jgi:hypothetical protein
MSQDDSQPANTAVSIPFSLNLTPGVGIPLDKDAETFSLGGGGTLAGRFGLPFFTPLSVGPVVSFALMPFNPANGASGSFSVISAGVSARLGFQPVPWLSMALLGEGGWYVGFASDQSLGSGSNPYLGGGAEINVRITDNVSIGLTGLFPWYLGLCYYPLPIAAGSVTWSFGGVPSAA